MHHTRADTEGHYIKRENVRKGLIQRELTNKTTTTGL